MDSLAIGSHHASAVAFDDFGVLILGGSGSGKSNLAIDLIHIGANLISDDVSCIANDLSITKPDQGPALLEIRHVGLFHAPMQQRATLKLIVHLDMQEHDRLPLKRNTRIGEHPVVLIAAKGIPNLDKVVAHFVRYGRAEP
ncbi:MAG: hypothetical protein AAF429_10735 [Pseudomonadota bacterium]